MGEEERLKTGANLDPTERSFFFVNEGILKSLFHQVVFYRDFDSVF